MGLGIKNHRVGENQQRFSRQTRVQFPKKKNALVVILKDLGAKTN
jgi:hypothetical protein